MRYSYVLKNHCCPFCNNSDINGDIPCFVQIFHAFLSFQHVKKTMEKTWNTMVNFPCFPWFFTHIEKPRFSFFYFHAFTMVFSCFLYQRIPTS